MSGVLARSTLTAFRSLRTPLLCTKSPTSAARCFSALPSRLEASTEARNDDAHGSVRDLMSLKGKTVVVTGGGRGIGFSICRAVAEMGGNVAILDMLDKPDPEVKSLAGDFGIETHYIKADVTKEDSLTKAFDEVASTFGKIDGLVTAAGIVIDKPFFDHKWAETERIQQVNSIGTFFSAQLAAKQMAKQGHGGSIVLIASICSHQAIPGQRLAAYNMSKGGVRILGTALAVELAPEQIRVNSISPGYIMTPMTKGLEEQYPHLIDLFHSAPPLKRMGRRRDIVGAAIYCLRDASLYTTGADIPITGGLHSGRIV